MTVREELVFDAMLLAEARQAAAAAGTDLDGFVSRAVQEKLWSMRPGLYVRERASRADPAAAKAALARAGTGNPPDAGDEIDPDAS